VCVCVGDLRMPLSGMVAVLVKKALSVRSMTFGLAAVIFSYYVEFWSVEFRCVYIG